MPFDCLSLMQEKGLYGDSPFLDASRGGRGIQFPFAVTDRVIIKVGEQSYYIFLCPCFFRLLKNINRSKLISGK